MSAITVLWTTAGFSALVVIGQIHALLRLSRAAAAARRWQQAPGEIVASTVAGRANLDSTELGTFEPSIRYRYRVSGISFEGSRIGLGSARGSGTLAEAETTAARYGEGLPVKVLYDPADPASAILEPPATKDASFALVTLAVFLAILASVAATLANGGKAPVMASGLPWFVLLLPVLALGLSALIVVGARARRRLGREQLTWPTVEGVVTESTIRTMVERDDDDSNRTTERFRPVLRYSYQVRERDYVGTQITEGDALNQSFREHAERQIAPYPVGAAVRVFHDPNDPRNSLLEPGKGGGFVALNLGAALLALLAVAMTWAFLQGQWS